MFSYETFQEMIIFEFELGAGWVEVDQGLAVAPVLYIDDVLGLVWKQKVSACFALRVYG